MLMADPVTLHQILTFAAAAALLFAAANDIAVRIVPNGISLIVAVAGIGLNALDNQLLPALFGAGLVFSAAWFCWRNGWIGGGDVKLLAACTLLVAPTRVPELILAIAVAGGALASLYLALGRLLRNQQPSRPTPHVSEPEPTPASRPEPTPMSWPERTHVSWPEPTPVSRPESTPVSRPERTHLSWPGLARPPTTCAARSMETPGSPGEATAYPNDDHPGPASPDRRKPASRPSNLIARVWRAERRRIRRRLSLPYACAIAAGVLLTLSSPNPFR